MEAAASSKETQNADGVDEARSSVELCFELGALPTESESEAMCIESNGSETSELLCLTSDFEKVVEMHGIREAVTNDEMGEDENIQGFSDEEEVEDSSRLLLAAKRGHVEVIRSLLMQSDESDVDAFDTKQNTPLHFAAAFGHKDVVDLLLSNNSKVDCKNPDNQTPLHLVSEKGHIEIVDALIRHGATVNACSRNSMTPLHVASEKGHIKIVKALIRHGATANACNRDSMTPLHLASENGHIKIVEALIRHGATSNACNRDSMTPLHLASENGHAKNVEALIHHGATVNECNRDSMTPLHLASENGHIETVEALIRHGATVNERNRVNMTPHHLASLRTCTGIEEADLIRHDATVHESDNLNMTPLHLASKNGHTKIVEALIRHGATVNVCNRDNMTPLHLASKHGHTKIVEALIRHGATVNACNRDNMTPLLLASENGHSAIVEALIRHGATVNACNRDNMTPLHLASENGHIIIVTALIRHGATFSKLNIDNMTPLHLASENGDIEIVEALIRHGATVNASNRANMTPLHLASENGHVQIVEALIRHGATVNACNSFKLTPLHLAAQNGRTSIVVILLDNHAIVDVVKQSQKTPFYLAIVNGHAEVVDVLLRRRVSDFISLYYEMSPLHVAIKNRHTKVVEVILKHSGNTSKKISEDENEHQDNVGNLVETRNIKPVELKKSDSRLASAEIVWAETNTPLELMRGSYGDNALEQSVLSIQPKIVEILLRREQCVYSEKHLAHSFRYLTLAFNQTDANKFRSVKKIAEVLLNSDRFNVNHQGKESNTPLHDVLKECKKCFYDYPAKKSSEQILQIQTIHDIINLLLKKGADFNIKNCYGETALIIASQNGCLRAVQILLDWQHKTGMKLDVDARDQYGATALIKATETHHVAVMQLLLKNKASVNLHDYYGYTALHAAIYEPKNRNSFDLHFFFNGLRKRKLDINDHLEISHWSRPTFESDSGVPYKVIVKIEKVLRYDETKTRSKEEMVKLLLSLDETNMNATDFTGNTPLDLAVKSFIPISEATINELKNRGVIQKLREPKNEPPVHVAGVDERGRNPVHRLIISQISKYGHEPMKTAKREEEDEWLHFMVDGFLLKPENFRHFATLKDDKGRTPLHYAVMPQSYTCKQDCDVVRVLLELGSDVNATDTYGKTPLHYAEMNEDNDIYKYLSDEYMDSDNYNTLLKYGADETIKDRYGYTPRDLKQLRDKVKINASSSKNLPIRMKKLYVSRKIKTNHMTELAKQKLPVTIKIFSQSPRCPESPEEAIWKIWIQNDFIRLNRRVSHLKTPIQQFMDRLAHSIKEKDSRFECQPMLVGSAEEETKVILSADFVYNFKLNELSQLCEVFPHPLGPEGYFELRRKSNDDTKSQNDEAFDCFFNSDQCLMTREVNSRFQIILEEVLRNANFWKDEHLFEWNITDTDLKKIGKPAGLCKTVRLIMVHPIDDMEGGKLFVNISIDIVACVYVEGWWPRDPLPVGISTIVNKNGCMMVFDRPRFDPSDPELNGFHFSETFARISFAPVESRIIKESSPVIKAAYTVCKMILNHQPKTTYQLKTCFLFCLEAANNRNVSEVRNEDEITRTELAFWVERLMFCFVEFSRHDVYPCYLMPSFRQRVENLSDDYEDLKSRKADKKNENSDIKIPCNYSEAFDLYLDLCPDDAAIDIPLVQENYDLVDGSLNANHDPTWKQFDRKEFIRKLSSRSLDKQCNSSMIM